MILPTMVRSIQSISRASYISFNTKVLTVFWGKNAFKQVKEPVDAKYMLDGF
jgi:hypothetical protein